MSSEERTASGELEAVIGLEIHVQLKTMTKMFCGCELSFGEAPNTRTCPVCLGLPGALPVANERAVHLGLMIGLALGSELADRSIFHRKNYFYPDLPKGYQISQYDEPLCRGGRLGEVRIHRVHLEEDAAKLVHVGTSGRIHGSNASLVDFNRGGTPLVEIVTEPDLRSAAEVREWLTLLRVTLQRLGVSDVNMEEGSLRCDANISLRPFGTQRLGTKTELKNMNSFRFLERAIRAEIERQRDLIASGGTVIQETLHFDPTTPSAGGAAERISSLRSKEEAHDYRYFPDPDLVAVAIDASMVRAAAEQIPELPAERSRRFAEELGLNAQSAQLLAYRQELGDYFEAALAADVEDRASPQTVANWISIDLVGRLSEGEDPVRSAVTPGAIAALAGLVASKQISVGAGRLVLDRLVADGGEVHAIVRSQGLAASEDDQQRLGEIVAAAVAAHGDAAEQVRAGNSKAIGPIIGYVMRETSGRADGTEVTRLVNQRLGI